MSLFEKTVYPQLASAISAEDLTLYFTPTEDEIAFVNTSSSRRIQRSRWAQMACRSCINIAVARFPNPPSGSMSN